MRTSIVSAETCSAVAATSSASAVHAATVASILVGVHVIEVVRIVVVNRAFDRRLLNHKKLINLKTSRIKALAQAPPYRLQQIHYLHQAFNALLFLADNLSDTICALRCNVGENLQTTSNLLQGDKNGKTLVRET